jgi:hypothetical protein
MRRRHALVAAFAVGALTALAFVAATNWSGLVRLTPTGVTTSPSSAGVTAKGKGLSPVVTPSPAGQPVATPTLPAERAGPIMVYDPENHGVLMFGGSTHAVTADGSNAVSLGDTWLWNGKSWSLLTGDGPSTRSASVAAYDSVRHVIVLFGGSGPAGVGPAKLFDDTWTWDGTTWTQQFPAHKPNPRFDAAIAFDQRRGVTVMYGGLGQTETYDDTWTWDGTDWMLQNPATTPGDRHFFSMVYDGGTGLTVLFGGTLPGKRLNDTWTWDGVTWAKQQGPPPVASGFSFLAYDAATKQVVAYVYFGLDNYPVAEYTITWDGTKWTDRTSPQDPSPRTGIAMAYDPENQRVVMFGPANQTETWIWDGATWSLSS